VARVDVTVSGRFTEPGESGRPAVGVLRFTLPQPLVDVFDGTVIAPVDVEGPLDPDGYLSVTLATLDSLNAVYHVIETIVGAPPRRYRVVIPASGYPINIAQVQPPINVEIGTVPSVDDLDFDGMSPADPTITELDGGGPSDEGGADFDAGGP
jgi:hypothetical protein